MSGGGFRLPRRRRAAHPRPAGTDSTIRSRSRDSPGRGRQGASTIRTAPPSATSISGRFPDRESLAARLRRVDAAGRAGGAFDGPFHHDADLARMPVAVRLLRHPDLQRGQVAFAQPRSTWSRSSSICSEHGYGAVYFVDDHFLLQPKRIEAICKGIIDKRLTIQWGCEGPRRFGRPASVPGDG